MCKHVGYIPIREFLSPHTWNYYYSTASNGAFLYSFRVGMSTNCWNNARAENEEIKWESNMPTRKFQWYRRAHLHNSTSKSVVYITRLVLYFPCKMCLQFLLIQFIRLVEHLFERGKFALIQPLRTCVCEMWVWLLYRILYFPDSTRDNQ